MSENPPTPLERVEATGNLRAMQRDPTKVIRSERFIDLQEVYGDTFECVELATLANRLYGELETLYGISVPTNIVVDADERGDVVIGQAVDRIDGVSLDQAEPTPELAEKAEELYTSVARYLYEKSTADDYYLVDLNNPTQYMYGRSLKDQESQIHLVDTDIYLNKGKDAMYLVMEWLTRHMSGVECQFGVKFDRARQYIQRFVDESCDAKEGASQHLENIRAFLRGEKFGPAPERGIPEFET